MVWVHYFSLVRICCTNCSYSNLCDSWQYFDWQGVALSVCGIAELVKLRTVYEFLCSIQVVLSYSRPIVNSLHPSYRVPVNECISTLQVGRRNSSATRKWWRTWRIWIPTTWLMIICSLHRLPSHSRSVTAGEPGVDTCTLPAYLTANISVLLRVVMSKFH